MKCYQCNKEIEYCKSPFEDKPLCDDCLANVFRQYFNQDIPYSKVNFKSPMEFIDNRPVDYSALNECLKQMAIRLAVLGIKL